MVEALLCLTLAIRTITLQTTPQVVQVVTEYQSCQTDTTISVRAIRYHRIDNHKKIVKDDLEGSETLWSTDIGAKDGSAPKD